MNKDTQSNKIETSKEITNYFLIKREDVMRMESNLKLLSLFVLFVSRARWNGSWFSPSGKPLKIGQFFFGNQELADKLGCNIKTVRRLVVMLDSNGYITLDEKNNYGSIATICNLGLFSTQKTQSQQSEGSAADNGWVSKRIQTNHVTRKPIDDIYTPLVTAVTNTLNKALGSDYKPGSKQLVKSVTRWVDDGYGLKDFEAVIWGKKKEWAENPKMKAYLRPSTLFGPKFEEYLNTCGKDDSELAEILGGDNV